MVTTGSCRFPLHLRVTIPQVNKRGKTNDQICIRVSMSAALSMSETNAPWTGALTTLVHTDFHAGPYVNVETNAGWTGSDYTGEVSFIGSLISMSEVRF